MSGKYAIGDLVVVEFEDIGREVVEVDDVFLNDDGTHYGYTVKDSEGTPCYVQSEAVVCAAAVYDGEINEDMEAEEPVTAADILEEMRADAEERLAMHRDGVLFEEKLVEDLTVALHALRG